MRNAMWVGGGITGMGEIPMLGVREKGIAKVIRDIFRNGEQGFFYDPSDLKSQYQDAAGTTVVNASGQPLGLVLDKSRPVLGGQNIFENILTVNEWSKSNPDISVSIVSGMLRISKGAITPKSVYKVFSCEANKLYKLSVKYKNHTGNNVRFFIRNASGAGVNPLLFQSIQTGVATEGSGDAFFISTSTTHSVVVDSQNEAESSVDVESITVVKVSDSINHAYQTTSAARPILQQTPILGNELVVNGDFSNSIDGWGNASVTAIVENGRAKITYTSGGGLFKDIPVVAGKTYKVSKKSENISGSSPVLYVYGSVGFSPIIGTIPPAKSGIYVTATASSIRVYLNKAGVGEAYWDDISVKEITGYHTDQNYIEYDGVDDKLVTDLPAPLTNATVLRSVPGVGTQVKYNQTLPMLYEDSSNHSGLVAIDRVLTRKEQLRLMEELDKRAGATSLDTLTFKAFDNNQEGFVFDPNDLSTMFQDVAGTIPVTAAGQPVGLMLDKSKGLVLGKELAGTNGAWAVDNGQGWSRTGTVYKKTSGVASGLYINKPVTETNTKWFKFKVTIVLRAGNIGVFRNNKLYRSLSTVGTTTLEFIFRPSEGATNPRLVDLYAQQSFDGDVDISLTSLQEIQGNHAYQETSASRPILRQNAVTGANYLEFDGTDDRLTTNSFPSMGLATTIFAGSRGGKATTAAVVARGVPGYIYQNSGQVAVQSANNPVKVLISGNTVITAKYAASGTGVSLKVNNLSSTDPAATDRGLKTSNPLTIGAFSANGEVPYLGHIYGLIGIGKLTSDSETEAIEKELAKRTGVTLNV